MYTLRSTITANDGVAGDLFGFSTATSADGHTVVVGAPAKATIHGPNTGTIYIYSVTGNFFQASLVQEIGGSFGGDGFGTSVDISDDGNVIVVGAPNAAGTTGFGNGHANHGKVYVYRKSGATYLQDAVIQPDFATITVSSPASLFGTTVALSGDGQTVIIGNGSSAFQTQKIAAFANASPGVWNSISMFDPGLAYDSGFGASVSIDYSGKWAVVGAPRVNAGSSTGQAYILHLSGSFGLFQSLSMATYTFTNAGASVYISSNASTVAVGAPDTNYLFTADGCVLTYERSDPNYFGVTGASPSTDATANALLYPPSALDANNLGFGNSLGLSADGNFLYVGAKGTSGNMVAYLRSPVNLGTWDMLAEVDSPVLVSGEKFAASFGVSADTLWYWSGAPGDSSNKGKLFFYASEIMIRQFGVEALNPSLTTARGSIGFDVSNANSTLSFSNTNKIISQKFQLASATSFDSGQLYLNVLGSPTGSLVVRCMPQVGINGSTNEDDLIGQSATISIGSLGTGPVTASFSLPAKLSAGAYFLEAQVLTDYLTSYTAGVNELQISVHGGVTSQPDVQTYDGSSWTAHTNVTEVFKLTLTKDLYTGVFGGVNFPTVDSNPNTLVSKSEPFNYSGGEYFAIEIDGTLNTFFMSAPSTPGNVSVSEAQTFLNSTLTPMGATATVVNTHQIKIKSNSVNGYARFVPKWDFATPSLNGTAPVQAAFQWNKGYNAWSWQPDNLGHARPSATLTPAVGSVRKDSVMSEYYANSQTRRYSDELRLTTGPQVLSLGIFPTAAWGWTKIDLINFVRKNWIEQPSSQIVPSGTTTIPTPTFYVNIVIFEGTIITNFGPDSYLGAFWYY